MIGNLPGYWCLFEALNLSLLKSKEPSWIGLYSTPKAFAILVLLAASFIILRFISPRLYVILDHIPIRDSLKNISALKIFFILLILTRVALINAPCSVGEDVAQQVLTTRQWVDGESSSPNFLSSPQRENLSAKESNWILRPPGASWIPLPGLILGLPVGHSIQISLFLLSIAFGTGWLKLARALSLSIPSLQLLACILAITASLGSLSLSTASVITSATFPWLLIWSLHLGDQWKQPKQTLKIHLLTFLFFLAIGIHALFKFSSLLTLAGIVLIPFIIFGINYRKINLIFCNRAIMGIILFFFLSLGLANSTNNLPELVLMNFIRIRITMRNMNSGENILPKAQEVVC